MQLLNLFPQGKTKCEFDLEAAFHVLSGKKIRFCSLSKEKPISERALSGGAVVHLGVVRHAYR